MYTSTKTGDWDSPWDLIGFLVVAFKAIRAHASLGMEIDRRARALHKEEVGDGPMRPEREASVHVRHLRNLQPMDSQVAEGVLAYGDTLRWAERKMRGMLGEHDETVTDGAKHVHEAVQALDAGSTDEARKQLVEALETLQTLPNVDAGLELAGYGELEAVS